MSTAARKARKRAGLPAPIKPAKIPTPVKERAFVTAPVFRKKGDAWPAGTPLFLQLRPFGPRAPRRAKAFVESGGVKR